MEEIETPIEKIQEQINELAEENSAEHHAQKWISQVALSSALIAVFAAVAALLAGHHSNEALIDQIQASDQWGYYQAKGVKANLLSTKIDLGAFQGRAATPEETKKLEQYKTDQEKIAEAAKEKEEGSHQHLKVHSSFATSVTFFQVAIAISAIAILVRRRKFWFASLGFAGVGFCFFLLGLLA
jgi:hypothetical protein